ncbi:MAG: hypothetical protein U0414_14830 [Polyangiaceae bacterium]
MVDIAYTVHTKSCSFMLDDAGMCRRILSSTGMVPPDIKQCIGAQFVACLDLTLEGGLAGELLLGAAALFVKQDATGRMQLLRTGMIFQVETRPDLAALEAAAETGPPARSASGPAEALDGPFEEETEDLPPPSFAETPVPSRGGDTIPPPKPTLKRAPESLRELAAQVLDVNESTVTLTLPLYRQESQSNRAGLQRPAWHHRSAPPPAPTVQNIPPMPVEALPSSRGAPPRNRG